MPDKATIKRAEKDKAEGKSASTQAGEFIKETIDDMRKGKHGARSTKQAIAIGLSKARRAGVDLPLPKKGTVSEKTRRSAELASKAGREHPHQPANRKRSRATTKALQRESTAPASHAALSQHARQVAKKKTTAERSEIARRAARTRKANQNS